MVSKKEQRFDSKHSLRFIVTPIIVNELIDVTYEIPNDAIDCACISFKLKNELVDGVPSETNHHINIEHSDIKMLLKEMKTVRSLMDETK